MSTPHQGRPWPSTGGATGSTALATDHYELTMVQAGLRSGAAERRAVFEVFARRLPPGRRYGVVAGLGRLVEALPRFRFGAEELAFLRRTGVVDEDTARWLDGYRFTGSIDAYPEGELYFPGSPVLTVSCTFADALLLETLVLSVLNHDSAVASAASRMVCAADGRTLVEMGGRRTHEEAAVAAARAAYLSGFAATSNLEAGRRWGIPTTGTAAHAFILAHADERAAFAAQVAAAGAGTTLLVDTFDVEQGIRTAVEVAGPALGAIRIDSGDLAQEARRARALLDELGAARTRIVVSGDLDEFAMEELADAPVDAYGVGTRLVTGSGHPTASFVYKLVAVADEPGADAPLRPVAKRSASKASVGGRKWAWREVDGDGHACGEHYTTEGTSPPSPRPGLVRPLQVRVVDAGRVVHRPSLADIRAHHAAAMAELPPVQRMTVAGAPALVADDATPDRLLAGRTRGGSW